MKKSYRYISRFAFSLFLSFSLFHSHSLTHSLIHYILLFSLNIHLFTLIEFVHGVKTELIIRRLADRI